MRMRVIEAQYLETAEPCRPPCMNVIGRVNLETIGVPGDISRPHSLNDGAAGTPGAPVTNDQAATLRRRRFACVRHDVVVGATTQGHNASTAMAIPIPPPMHSAATP